jgi:hypothetical protein
MKNPDNILKNKILSVLNLNPSEEYSAQILCEFFVRYKFNSVQVVLGRLLKEGLIIRTRHGFYASKQHLNR